MNDVNLNQQLDIAGILTNLTHNDFAFHVTLTTLIEMLKNKKDVDGNPLIDIEAFNKKAQEVQETLVKEVQKRRLITPGTGSVPPINSTKND